MRVGLVAVSLFVLAACGADPTKGKATAEADAQPAPSAARAAEAPPVNLLTLAEGAVLVSASHDAAAALALTDGNVESRWSANVRRAPGPYVFVFELRAPTTLSRVGIDGAGARPGGVAGASAKNVLIEGSAQGADAGFTRLAAIEAAADGETLGAVSAAAPVRWLRFTVSSNQSGADWIYFDEVIAQGAQTPPANEGRFNGVFQTARADFLELKQSGTSLTGCYVENSGRSNGSLTGDVSEGVARLKWRSQQGVSGPALLTIDSRGHIAGVRYRDRSRSAWGGPPAPAGTTTPCSAAAAPANPISEALQNAGEARIYGILFDFDRDTIKSSSLPALRQLKEALEADAAMNVDIEGHTDAVGEDAYNLSLSQRRAAAVVAWLTREGVAGTRLTPVGKGETEPVASNDTADGRALNRRVEVAKR